MCRGPLGGRAPRRAVASPISVDRTFHDIRLTQAKGDVSSLNVDSPETWLTTGDVARRAGVTSQCVRYWADSGKLRHKRLGKVRVFPPDAVELYLRVHGYPKYPPIGPQEG